jgi:hypothetical protein
MNETSSQLRLRARIAGQQEQRRHRTRHVAEWSMLSVADPDAEWLDTVRFGATPKD